MFKEVSILLVVIRFFEQLLTYLPKTPKSGALSVSVFGWRLTGQVENNIRQTDLKQGNLNFRKTP